mmetsp:Transcript_22501/g.89348  ORF Transcript_22501/g.89348 Transcript_22501/m.89348 type:complete len:113 (+) Transcript_22501:4970-5308(+)
MNCDEAVEEHFKGIHGLRNELIAAGLMDEATGAIKDPSRIMNIDETPQFVGYADNKGGGKKKYAAGEDDVCLVVATENRECNTVMMCWGLDGMQYGVQIIVARKAISENLAI